MAKHSSFKNLVALEACQNFFLITGSATESAPEPGTPGSPKPSDGPPSGEDAVQTANLSHPSIETIANAMMKHLDD